MLHDVVLGAADIIIDAGPHIGDVIAAFETISRGQHKTLSDIGLDLAIDPFAPQSDVAVLEDGLRVLGRSDERQIPQGVFRLNGWQWHNQGMSQIQELGLSIGRDNADFPVWYGRRAVSGADRAHNSDEHCVAS